MTGYSDIEIYLLIAGYILIQDIKKTFDFII